MTQDLLIAEPEPVRNDRAHAVGKLTRQTVLPVLTAVALLAVWEVSVELTGLRPVILPAPSAVLETMWANRELLVVNAIPTAVETVGGFALSVVFGGLLGILLSYSTLARDSLYPNVILFQLVPKVAVAPLFMLWLGIGWESRLAISLFIAFFPIVISTVSGLNAADAAILRLCDSLTATRTQVFFKIRLPYSLPFLFNGMKISMTLAIIGVIVGEFITSQRGLGYIILFAGSRLETAIVMAALLVLCIVGLVLYGLVALAEQKVLPHVDFEEATRLAVSRAWSRASAQQQKALVTEFRAMLLRTYTNAIGTYAGMQAKLLPTRGKPQGESPGSEATVRYQFSRSGGKPVLVAYEMRKTGAGWKIYDVSVEGMSLVLTYRTEFDGILKQEGIDGLISRLAQKNAPPKLGA